MIFIDTFILEFHLMNAMFTLFTPFLLTLQIPVSPSTSCHIHDLFFLNYYCYSLTSIHINTTC